MEAQLLLDYWIVSFCGGSERAAFVGNHPFFPEFRGVYEPLCLQKGLLLVYHILFLHCAFVIHTRCTDDKLK